MHTISALRALHDRALSDCGELVAAAADADLGAPTPCTDWDLAALLRHMVGQNNGFAAAVADGDAPLSAYEGPTITAATLMPSWSASSARVRAAFALPTAGDIHLTELGLTVPVERALGMHLLDTVVHAWDVARSLGRDHRPADDLVGPILAGAREIAERPGGAPGVFADPVVVSAGGSPPASPPDPWTEALRLLGRRP